MLTIHPVKNAADAKKYYSASDYYAEGQSQETVGRWGGKLAGRLGLSGMVDKIAFDWLCDNLHPATGERLTQRTNDNRRIGYDFTFSAPKSFSILEGLANDEGRRRLLGAFDAAIDETMAEAEADMQTRVRLDGERCDRVTGNAVWASFDHSTARPVDAKTPPDPHRHRHVVVFNATHDPVEDRIKAGEFSYMKRDGEYYAAAFYSRLAKRLEAEGFVIERKGGKEWEIAGVPSSVIEKFSKRTAEVEAEAERLGVTDAGRKAELGAKTRSKKQKQQTPQQLRKEWAAQLSDAQRRALVSVYRKEIEPGERVTAAEAVRFAVEHVGEKLSVAPEREFKRVALLHGLGDVTLEQVERELPRQGVLTGEIDGRTMATTEALQHEEDYIAGIASAGRGEVKPVGLSEGLSRTLEDGKQLNDGQWKAVIGLLESSNRVNLVEGPAGAGKSSLLAKFDEGVRRAGGRVIYLGTTSTAAAVLARDGFDAKTVAHFLLDERLQKQAAGGRVVIDESSMLGHADAVRLYDLARKLDLKLIHVGDPMQHGAVPRGAFLHVLKTYGHIKPFQLTQIMRQELPAYRSAADLLSQGRTSEGFDAIDQLGWVRELGDDERYKEMAAEYVEGWKELEKVPEAERVLCVSPTHAEAALITAEIRSRMREAGLLESEEQAFTRLVQIDASEPERGLATTYQAGDVLQFHQNAKGFKKGDRLIVRDPARVPLAEAAKFSLYRPAAIGLAAGDRVRFTGTVKTADGKHTLRNGASHTVAAVTQRGFTLDNGWKVDKDAGHFRHGFVETSFGSQGRTVRRVILGMSSSSLPATNAEQMYVSASRAKEKLTLFTDDKESVAWSIRRSSAKAAALDLKAEARALPDVVPPRAARRRRMTLLDHVRSSWEKARLANRPAARPAPRQVPVKDSFTTRVQQERDYGHER